MIGILLPLQRNFDVIHGDTNYSSGDLKTIEENTHQRAQPVGKRKSRMSRTLPLVAVR